MILDVEESERREHEVDACVLRRTLIVGAELLFGILKEVVGR